MNLTRDTLEQLRARTLEEHNAQLARLHALTGKLETLDELLAIEAAQPTQDTEKEI